MPKTKLEISLIVFLSLIALFQFAFIAGNIYKTAAPYGIVAAKSDDAAITVAVAGATRWWNDNTFRPYGVVYYRVAHTLALFMNDNDSDLTKKEANEKKHHFVLMVISLLSLYGISYLLAFIITKSLAWQLLITTLLVSLFSFNEIWVKFIFTAHPDILLSFLMGLTGYFAWKLIHDPSSKRYLILTGVLFGITTSTKMITIFMIPAILFFIPFKPFNNYLRTTSKLFLYSLAAYFIIGFPQNFIFWKVIRFLTKQTEYSAPLDHDAFIEWLTILKNLALVPAIVLFLISLLPISKPDHTISIRLSLKFMFLSTIPLIILFSGKILTSHEHYPMPFAVLLMVAITGIGITIRSNFPRYLFKYEKYGYLLILIGIATLALFKTVQTPVIEHVKRSDDCRSEIETIYSKISSYVEAKEETFVDPYIPSPKQYGKQRILDQSWWRKFDDFTPKTPKHLFLSKNYYSRYTVEVMSEYAKKGNDELDKTILFYKTFAGKDKVIDPFGQKWIKVYSDKCGYEEFQLIN